MKASYYKHILEFKAPSGTSRGVLSTKETWFLVIEREGKKGIGECAILRGLSMDDVPDYEEKLRWTCQNIHLGKEVLWDALKTYPSIQFGVETAFLSLEASDPFLLYPSDFTLQVKRESLLTDLFGWDPENSCNRRSQLKLKRDTIVSK